MPILEDVTVVAVEQAVAAPLASRHLADLGARVIKIERPGTGDFARNYDTTVNGLSSHFVWLNRSKQSLTLDLKADAARNVLLRLLDSADVLIQNLAPGALARLGLDLKALRQNNPRLILCNISGYGEGGPYQGRKAYDLLVQAETGLLSVTGTEAEPAKAGISVADIAAGMYAYSGVLAALLRRHKTGVGGVVDVSLFDALSEWMSYPAYFTGYGGIPPARTGPRHATIAPYGPYAAGDGRVVLIGVQNEREWSRFCRVVLQREEAAHDARFDSNSSRVRNRRQLDQLIEESLSDLSSQVVLERLEKAGIAYGRMNNMEEFFAHPQLKERGMLTQVESSVGTINAMRPPAHIDAEEPSMGPIPSVGEHSEMILLGLGYSPEEIGEFQRTGVI